MISTQSDGHTKSIVTYIKDENELQRFIKDLGEILEAPEFSKTKLPKDETLARLDNLVRSLVNMRADPRNIHGFLRSNPKVLSLTPSKWDLLLGNVRFVNELGLYGNRVLLVLDRNSRVWTASREQLAERIKELRKLGLVEGSLQKVIKTWPDILTLKKSRLNATVEMLRACLFSSSHIATIITTCPKVLDDNPTDIERRFQYVYYTMGLQSQEQMVAANLFKYSLAHTRRRHAFLERLGLYETPDKKGHTRSRDNPQLARIIDCSDARFTARCAGGIPPEEFEMFARSLEAEERAELGKEEDEVLNEETDEDLRDYDHTKDR